MSESQSHTVDHFPFCAACKAEVEAGEEAEVGCPSCPEPERGECTAARSETWKNKEEQL